MKLLKKIYHLINPPIPPTYGKSIFDQKSWLTRKVEDAQWKQAKAHIYKTR